MTPVVNRIISILTDKPRGFCGRPLNNLFIVTLESNENIKLSTEGESISDAEHVYKRQGIVFIELATSESLNTSVFTEQLASAVSALIDRLPGVLHANTPEVINTWVVAGLGLGAHAAWMAMDRGTHSFLVIT
ncbi:hypothetical protein OPQ81_007939 [Rhizoctonia solani]|nr:hypothetical protein OPQ81_007939 [Rhizoctonia solani]